MTHTGKLYVAAKRRAMQVLAEAQSDQPVPDAIRFIAGESCIIRLSCGDRHVQQVMTWNAIDSAVFDIVGHHVRLMVEQAARADFQR